MSDAERGPNGFPYVDPEKTSVAGWESGDYKVKLARSDGEMVIVNFTPDQMDGLSELIEDTIEKHETATEESE